MSVPSESETICPIRRAQFSRRSFVKTAFAVTAGFLAESGSAAATQYLNISGGPPNRSQSGELTNLSIDAASRLVRLRKLSPVELTNACLAQIEKLNPALNAFITVTAESAATEARTAEAEIQRGKWRGPLHGIPIALKDLFDTVGVRTTAGSGVFKDRVPAQDAEVVRAPFSWAKRTGTSSPSAAVPSSRTSAESTTLGNTGILLADHPAGPPQPSQAVCVMARSDRIPLAQFASPLRTAALSV